MNKFSFKLKLSPCPKCGNPDLQVYFLRKRKVGIWCNSCLAGIPNSTIPAGNTIKEAIENFELYEKSLKSGKSE